MNRFVLAGAAWIIAIWTTAVAPGVNAAERAPVTQRTLVFSRSQMKYGLDGNYMRRWVDRPLFVDPTLRVEERKYAMALPSYRRILKNVASYGLDGLAFFPETSGRMGAFEFTDESAVPGISLLPVFIATDNWSTVEVIYNLTDMRLRVNGKEAGPFECQGVGLYDMTSVIGGFGSAESVDQYDDANGWFDGFVTAVSVAHGPFESVRTH
jgi:hypothetical protein